MAAAGALPDIACMPPWSISLRYTETCMESTWQLALSYAIAAWGCFLHVHTCFGTWANSQQPSLSWTVGGARQLQSGQQT